ncbi:putative zinc-type alcohol dehydrogenase [Hyphodiscus hymeniophilus]|uniref:Zinc-type alcohol dehydrogenase n=1 Tax=Hyphodiscus hymeniophilus TaxID=353542 RepID=A0A9P7B0T8_9HELO|nr:putative zinc-type alcohol dehydrogenase [Hyphodiscus hymeniophilus]
MKSHGHDSNGHEDMKAVEWEGKPFSMTVKSIPVPRIINPQDAVIRCTSSGICGSDLHVFHGRIPAILPMTMGHEVVGIVHSIGEQVQDLKVGDRVIVSAVINEDLLDGETKLLGGLAFGTYPGIEQFNGGQAAFVRVPFATDNCILLPQGTKHELDYVLLADIFPTANWALDASGFTFGDVVVVFGAGPVGLLCAYSALFRGASKVYSVDRVPQRLAKAKSLGAIPIDFTGGDPVTQILKLEPDGVNRSCDCVGYECVNAEGVNIGNTVIVNAINVTRSGGGIGVIGVYSPEDAGAATAQEKKGIFEIPFASAWFKSQSIKGGIVPLRQYQPVLKKLIESGRVKPSFVFDREIRIEDAAKAYTEFSNHDFIKTVICFEGGGSDSVVEDKEEKVEQPKKRRRNGGPA